MGVDFQLNGKAVTVRDDHPHLLAALREELDVTSPKDGCSPSGQCGCCTVLIDGKAIVSCQQSLAKTAGKTVTTLEGVAPTKSVTAFADAFAACGGLQCGFCIPGIVMRAKAQIDKKGADLQPERHGPPPRRPPVPLHRLRQDPRRHRRGRRGQAVRTGARRQTVGGAGAKYEAGELALGDRDYVDDMRVPGMLHAALHLTAHARAEILSIDTSPRWRRRAWWRCSPRPTSPASCGSGIIHKDWPVMIPVGGRTVYAGDVLADRRRRHTISRRAPPPNWSTSATTCCRRSPIPRRRWSTTLRSRCGAPTPTCCSVSEYARGDVDAASGRRRPHRPRGLPDPAHRARLPRTRVARSPCPTVVDGARHLHVYSGGQGVWDDRNHIASVLGVDNDRVTVELVSNGGAFGGKEDMSNQAQTALAAWLLDRPVKCTLSREESLLIHAKRHPIRLEYWAGCDADGQLTALRVRMIGDSRRLRRRSA